MFGQQNTDYVAKLTSNAVGMSDTQAKLFADTYSVVDQFTDPVSGFSGTVFEKDGKRYFAIRGTEVAYRQASRIGSPTWPTLAPMGSLLLRGWQCLTGSSDSRAPAVSQWSSTFIMRQRLIRTGNTIPAAIESTLAPANGLLSDPQASMTVTGHSLGGHLAMMLSRMAPSLFDAAYTYMAPGFDTSCGAHVAAHQRGVLRLVAGRLGRACHWAGWRRVG